jgi:hypothetical protein
MKVDPVLKHQVGEILTLVQKIAPGKSVELRIQITAQSNVFQVQSIGEERHQMLLK